MKGDVAMDRDLEKLDGYAKSVFDDTQRYIQKLLEGNDQARRKIATLESENAVLERDRLACREDMIELRERLARCQEDYDELQRRLREVEDDSRSYADEYLQLEKRNSNLVHLYVASYGLHGTVNRTAIVQSIKEIVINLIGSEELAVLELDGDDLRMIDSFGLAADDCSDLSAGDGLVGRVVDSGEPWIEGRSDDSARTAAEEHLTACIPLRVAGRVFGVLAIFRLLPQKSDGLVDLDYELFDLLAAQAGTALFCATLYDRHAAESFASGEAKP